MDLLEFIKENAKKQSNRIVLPEGQEPRTLKAADIALREGLAEITLIGNPDIINRMAADEGLSFIHKSTIVDPENFDKKGAYADDLVELRKHKGMTKEKAFDLLKTKLEIRKFLKFYKK